MHCISHYAKDEREASEVTHGDECETIRMASRLFILGDFLHASFLSHSPII